ncbi:mitochondrial carrier domain-containing protein [Aspergillus nidulans var. acristatus]
MSSPGTQGTSWDRYRSNDLTGIELDGHSAETWNWAAEDTDMAATSGTGSVSTVEASPAGEVSITQKMVSATCGSVLTGLLVTPLDVVRVRLQSQSPIKNTSPFTSHTTPTLKNAPPNLGVTACCREVFWGGQNSEICMVGPSGSALGATSQSVAECAVEETQRRTFTSTLDGLRKIARNEGVLTLWRGLSPTLMMGIPGNVIYFAGYDWLRTDDRSPIKRVVPGAYVPFVAGAVARVAAATAISPIEMFRTRLQATPGTGAGHFKATLEGLYQMTQAKGYGSLWRGFTLTMWRDVPFSGLYWWGYEEVKKSIIEVRKKARGHNLPQTVSSSTQLGTSDVEGNTFLDSFVAGSVSGALAALVTTPFDVGKTRQQVFRHMGDDAPSAAGSKLPKGPLQPEQLSLPKFLLHIFREEGAAGLFRGWVARCLKVAPACAIMISTYEVGKKFARDVNERRQSSPDGNVSDAS